MTAPGRPLHVSLVAVPNAALSTLTGMYDVLTSFALLATISDTIPRQPPFAVELVGEDNQSVLLAGDVPLPVHKSIGEIERTDIVILPSLLVKNAAWVTGQHPALVAWLKAMHERGAVLCSACSGVFLLAETGLLDRRDATIHWTYATGFARLFPDVRLVPERVLVETGDNGQFLMSGASTSWHDLVLYLIARHAGTTTAQAIARFFAMQWHNDGLAPYMVFSPPMDHGDAVVTAAQNWLTKHFSVASPVDDMVRR
ncbi:MAG TPA: DJ-1/PfpI family protein, partial [Arenicellales bacterium]|nr:DJ-1/PfpI family protein [Arenicellales bacterium]